MNTIEEVIQFTIAKDSTTGFAKGSLMAGQVTQVIVHSNNSNGDYLQLQIKDSNGTELTKMQHIDNYKMRNADYYNCGKPLFFDPKNKTIHIHLNAPNGVTEDVTGEVVFVYQCQN